MRRDQMYLERKFGRSEAWKLWEIGQAAVAEIDKNIAKHGIDAERCEGLIYADHRGRFVNDTHRYVDHLRAHYAYDKADKLDITQIRDLIRSKDYEGGMV